MIGSRSPSTRPDPARAAEAIERGRALWNAGKPAAALAVLEDGRRADPHDPIIFYWLALCYKALGFRRKARRAIETLLAVDPHRIEALCLRDSLVAAVERRRSAAIGGKRIVCHLNRPFHYGLLRPLFDILKR